MMDLENGEKATLSPEEQIRKLQAQVFQLKNCIKKLTGQEVDEGHKRKDRPFDFNLYCKRHIALHVCYLGWDFHGFAVQETTGKTIESELFKALVLTKLIKCREESNYHRCGRTDKGVSAFQQVITIDVRSNLMADENQGIFTYEGCIAEKRNNQSTEEINFCKILNSKLPPHIQVLAWAPCLQKDFSARFDCVSRTYKYFFPRGNLNLAKLNEAGQLLLGEHDFRNFCKMDVANGVVTYTRRIHSVQAERIQSSEQESYDMCTLTIQGKAFLWHQIRCIVSVLFRVAAGKEDPSVITELLDIEKNPRRPQYVMASEVPLNLFQCDYDPELDWQYDDEAVLVSMKQLQDLWTDASVKATMIKASLDKLSALVSDKKSDFKHPQRQNDELYGMSKIKSYIPLLQMDKCPSLEEKLAAPASKRRKNVVSPE